MRHGGTAHNRTVYASPPVGGSGYEKSQSGLHPLCGFSPPHFVGHGLCCAKPLFGRPKRRKQPER
jgi:hypothetical protein